MRQVARSGFAVLAFAGTIATALFSIDRFLSVPGSTAARMVLRILEWRMLRKGHGSLCTSGHEDVA